MLQVPVSLSFKFARLMKPSACTVFKQPTNFVRSYSENSEKKDADEKVNELQDTHSLQKTLDDCKIKLDEKDEQLVGYRDKYLHSLADFQNLQDRTLREVSDAKSYALRSFAKDLLASVDNFDLALRVVDVDKKRDPVEHKKLIDLYNGITMTQQVFEKTLASHGITKITPIGEKFDPNLCEAVSKAPQAGMEPGTVFSVEQTGFLYNGKVLRRAKVGVVLDQQ